jgi:hypothetical protein
MKALIIALLAVVAGVQAQEIRRAIPVDPWRSQHGETCWQWLTRTGLCTTGGCDKSSSPVAYLNWGDHEAAVFDNIELQPAEILLAPYPFIEPDETNPLYDGEAEIEIETRAKNLGISRIYRRGVFVGYILIQPPQQQLVKI